MPNSKSENLIASAREITSNLPLLLGVLVIFSFLNIYMYYNLFKINIYQYIDVSELFFSESLFTLVLSSIVIIPVFFLLVSLFFSFFKYHPMYLLIVGILIFGCMYFLTNPQSDLNELTYDFLLSLALICYYYWARYSNNFGLLKFLNRLKIKNRLVYIFVLRNHQIIIYSSLLIIFFLSISNKSIARMENILKQGGKFKVDLLLNTFQKEIHTNKTFVFLGQTKNYYFFRNLKSDTNIIIPTSTIIEARLVRLRMSL
jgi:hypothetical protein